MKRLLVLTAFLFLLATQLSAFRILHYTETTGYNHNTKSQSLGMFQDIGNTLMFTVTNDDDGSKFDVLDTLLQFKIVVFSNTSGSNGLNATQRANFEAYIANGGSYMGMHAASDTYRHSTANGNNTGVWDWYAETVVGASVQERPNHTRNNFNANMAALTTGTVLNNLLPAVWNKDEEYYYWENGYLNQTNFNILYQVERTGNNSYDAPRMTAHYRDLPGGGRSFYTSLGHNQRDYNTPGNNFRQLMTNAIQWICAAQQLPIEFLPEEELGKINPRIVNPSNGFVEFRGDMPKGRVVTMRVVSCENKEAYYGRKLSPMSGEMTWKENLNLAAGIYIVQVFDAGRYVLLRKLVVKQ